MRIQFFASGLRVRAKAEVRTSIAEEGMGVRFVEYTEQDGQKLEGLLNSLVPKSKESSSSPLMSRSDVLALKLERWFQQNEQLSREQFLRILTGRDQGDRFPGNHLHLLSRSIRPLIRDGATCVTLCE
jgi:hypothetical protein